MKIIVTVSPFVSDYSFERFLSAVGKAVKLGVHEIRINLKKLDKATLDRINSCIMLVRETYPELHISLDLPYPYCKPRIFLHGEVAPYQIKRGQKIRLTTDAMADLDGCWISIDSERLPAIGTKFFYADGQGQFAVEKSIGTNIKVIRAENDFEICNNKALVWIQNGAISRNSSPLIEINRMIAEYDITSVFVSFISHPSDLILCAKELKIAIENIIPKIETMQAITNIDSIAKMPCKRIMLARGDLGLNVPINQFAKSCDCVCSAIQKQNKGLIVATDVLSSMIMKPFPTRADIIDLDKIIRGYMADTILINMGLVLSPYFSDAVHIIRSFFD